MEELSFTSTIAGSLSSKDPSKLYIRASTLLRSKFQEDVLGVLSSYLYITHCDCQSPVQCPACTVEPHFQNCRQTHSQKGSSGCYNCLLTYSSQELSFCQRLFFSITSLATFRHFWRKLAKILKFHSPVSYLDGRPH